MAERGADGISLRELARAAGVSHAAPAHHFTDRRGLFTALAAEGWRLLADRARRRPAGVHRRGAGLCAVRARPSRPLRGDVRPFARRPRRPRADGGPGRRGNRAGAWGRHARKTRAPRRIRESAALAAWSLVHGFAMLWLNKAIDTDDDPMADVERDRRDAFRRVACGHDRYAADRYRTDHARRAASTTLAELADGAVLVVNVASKCGLTPQYTALEQLAKDYGERGLTVIGVPCNQFMGQEPGTAEEIQTFCSTTYGVTFPLLAKTDVNGADRHPLYAELTKTADDERRSGRHPVELREVPARARWRGRQPVPAAHRSRCARGDRRHRGGPAAITRKSQLLPACCKPLGHLTLRQ